MKFLTRLLTLFLVIGGAWNLSAQVDTNAQFLEQATLVASDGAEDDQFGISVSISGDYAVIGASYDDSRTGAAYIFKRNADGTWTQKAKLLASDGAEMRYFGQSVFIVGEYAIIGSGSAAYFFKRNLDETWSETAKFNFRADTVSMSGDYVGGFGVRGIRGPGDSGSDLCLYS